MRKKLLTSSCAWALVCFLASLGFADPAHAGATVTVVNNDGANEGFNDPGAPDPDSAAGGNTGATLGAQRLQAFQAAANIWGGIINSTVEIRINAQFNPLTCSATRATLGSAGPNFIFRNFVGAPFANTWYVEALRNALTGTDGSAIDDIRAQFNSSIGTICAFPNVWYYGLDGSPPGTKIDFVTVVLHEITHGLGFLSTVNLATGAKLMGSDDAYMRLLENHTTGELFPTMTDAERFTASRNSGNLHWTGTDAIACGSVLTAGRHATGHIEMFAPNPGQPGSSVAHWSTTLSPNQLMEPSYMGPLLVPDIDPCLLVDLGWTLMPTTTTTTTLRPTTTTTTTTLPALTCNGLTATIVGTNSGEVITGTPGADVIAARGGNDVVRGRGGNDVICGGNGRDGLFGQNGADKLFGQNGADQLFGENGNDAMVGGAGNDSCAGGTGSDRAFGCETTTSVP
ncbi:MAG: hypothetical protein ACREXS_01725 [Gammaproteobacteria bacterium]